MQPNRQMAKNLAQTVTSAQKWKERMKAAKAALKKLEIRPQQTQDWVAEREPAINKLTNATRWRNAWHCSNSDPEFTELVEAAVAHFRQEADKEADAPPSRLKRQKLQKGGQ